MKGRGVSRKEWLRPTIVIGAAVLLGLLTTRAFAVEPPPGKLDKQIGVMERIVDQVLIDSPNFLVSGRGTTRGLYVPSFGVILTFSASLVEKDRNWQFDFGKDFKIEKDGKGRTVLILPDDEDVEEIAEKEAKKAEASAADKEAKKAAEASRSRKDTEQERLYKKGKAELVDTLLDYGDTLSSLEKGKWVAVVGYLQDARYFDERGMSKLVLKAKIDDLRAYGADKLREEDMVKRIVELEY